LPSAIPGCGLGNRVARTLGLEKTRYRNPYGDGGTADDRTTAARRLLVVVPGSASDEARYVDTRNLFRWAWRKPGVP
jgi:D-alanyl-D-alanine carboxypeptidase